MAMTPSPLPQEQPVPPVGPETKEKLAALEARLKEFDGLMVAYSGGVDSSFLAAVAHRVLGDRMVAVLADSPSLARRELAEAQEFAREQGFALEIVRTEELDQPAYSRNDANRCFHCKSELFTQLKALAERRGNTRIAYGMNADDRGDYRPGQRAAEENEILAPLAEVGLGKAEIRALARAAGFTFWDRPAAPCLASRIEYGRAVTREALAQVEQAEEAIRNLGFHVFRVRHHGEMARVEIARAELPKALSLESFDALTAALKPIGFKYIALDCAGFRSGSLNAVLPADVLARKGA